MRRYKLPQKSVLIANYIGGLGYYALHFAWIIGVFLILMRMMQFVVLRGEPLLYTPPQTSPITAEQATLPGVVTTLLGIVLSAGLCVFMLLLPYWIGQVSRPIPRWLLAQTSWHTTLKTLLAAKQLLVAAVALASILTLYHPGAPAQDNIGFFVVSLSCVVAAICFGLQYTIATFQHIPERRIN